MNLFPWSLTLLLVASVAHAVHVPISRHKLSGFSPLEKRAQGHGGASYNVLAAGDSPNGLKSVDYPCHSAHVPILL